MVESNSATNGTGEWIIENIDAVLDCSGTYGNGNFLGPGGGPALGELSLRGVNGQGDSLVPSASTLSKKVTGVS